MTKDSLLNNKNIKLTMYLKINQLHRQNLENLSYNHLIDVLFHFKWKNRLPYTMHEAVDDILSLDANEIVKDLHTLAIMEGANQNDEIIKEFMGGTKYD